MDQTIEVAIELHVGARWHEVVTSAARRAMTEVEVEALRGPFDVAVGQRVLTRSVPDQPLVPLLSTLVFGVNALRRGDLTSFKLEFWDTRATLILELVASSRLSIAVVAPPAAQDAAADTFREPEAQLVSLAAFVRELDLLIGGLEADAHEAVARCGVSATDHALNTALVAVHARLRDGLTEGRRASASSGVYDPIVRVESHEGSGLRLRGALHASRAQLRALHPDQLPGTLIMRSPEGREIVCEEPPLRALAKLARRTLDDAGKLAAAEAQSRFERQLERVDDDAVRALFLLGDSLVQRLAPRALTSQKAWLLQLRERLELARLRLVERVAFDPSAQREQWALLTERADDVAADNDAEHEPQGLLNRLRVQATAGRDWSPPKNDEPPASHPRPYDADEIRRLLLERTWVLKTREPVAAALLVPNASSAIVVRETGVDEVCLGSGVARSILIPRSGERVRVTQGDEQLVLRLSAARALRPQAPKPERVFSFDPRSLAAREWPRDLDPDETKWWSQRADGALLLHREGGAHEGRLEHRPRGGRTHTYTYPAPIDGVWVGADARVYTYHTDGRLRARDVEDGQEGAISWELGLPGAIESVVDEGADASQLPGDGERRFVVVTYVMRRSGSGGSSSLSTTGRHALWVDRESGAPVWSTRLAGEEAVLVKDPKGVVVVDVIATQSALGGPAKRADRGRGGFRLRAFALDRQSGEPSLYANLERGGVFGSVHVTGSVILVATSQALFAVDRFGRAKTHLWRRTWTELTGGPEPGRLLVTHDAFVVFGESLVVASARRGVTLFRVPAFWEEVVEASVDDRLSLTILERTSDGSGRLHRLACLGLLAPLRRTQLPT